MSAKETLVHRLNALRAGLGQLAYSRREHQIEIERIDGDVAQMEAQQIVLEATLNEIGVDEENATALKEKDREDERKKRSARAKAAAAKKKRETPKAATRKGKGTTGA